MIFLSILAKTYAIAVAPERLWLAILLWAASIAADVLAIRKARGEGTVAALAKDVLLVQACALVLGVAAAEAMDYAAMRWKDGIPGVSHLTGLLVQAAGLGAGTFDGTVYLGTMAGPLEFSASIDHLGLRVPAVFLAIAGAWLLWAAGTGRQVAAGVTIALLVLLGVAAVRMVLAVLLFVAVSDFVGYETEELPFRPFAAPAFVLWSYLPVLLAAGPLVQRALPAAGASPPKAAGWPAWLRYGGIPAGLALLLLVQWKPAGEPKRGKLLISTFHTQWSPTSRPYDREWYGADSGYNYACLKRLYEKHYDVEELTGRIRASDLEEASVLMIYVPDKALSSDEIRLVRNFVRKGGGLFVVGDHTNVFGSTSHLNELCEPFGIQFRDDVLFDLDEDFHQVLDRDAVASSFGHGMAFFKLRGPASIRPTSLRAHSVFEIDHSKAVRAIYSVNNFYPPPHDHPKMETGTFCVAAAAHYGRGRVAAWGDSTVFSNFEIFYPGKYEYLLNTAHWLNHRNSLPGALLSRVAGAVLLVGLVVLLGRCRHPRGWLTVLVLLAAGWLATRSVVAAVERSRAEFPEPVRPMRVLYFAMPVEAPGYNLLDFTSDESYDRRYDVLLQWVLRTGAFSGVYLQGDPHREGLYEHWRKAAKAETGLAVIVRDKAELDWLARLGGSLEAGDGHVFVLVSQKVSAEDVAAALKESGIVTDSGQLEEVKAAWPSGEALFESNGRRVLVAASAERFSDQAMGITEKVTPTEQQRALFDQAFGLVDRLFGSPSPEPAPGAEAIPSADGASGQNQ